MNKKRLFTVLITLIFTLGLFTAPINASPLNEQHIVNREITYYSDGYYLETITYESNISTYGSSSKTGTKTATYYNGSTPLWYVSVLAHLHIQDIPASALVLPQVLVPTPQIGK